MSTPVYDPRVYGDAVYSDALLDPEVYGEGTLEEATGGSFTADAVIKRTQTNSFTADAVIRLTRTSSFTADAVVPTVGTHAATFSADAAKFKTQAGSFTANAAFGLTRSGSFTANANLFKATTATLTGDAIKRQTFDWRTLISLAAPRLWYRCDDASGGLIDYGAEARNASTVTGTPTYGAAGRIDGAVSLSGSQAFATASFALNLTNSIITIEAWVWPGTATYTGSTRQTIFSGNDTAGTPELELGADGGTNRIAAIINGTFVAVTADNALVPQTWNHIVYRRSGNGAGTHSFHVNGVSQSLGTNNPNNYTSTASIKRVGQRVSSQRFIGLIDEVIVYDRVISTTEIAAHYAILAQIPTADAVKFKAQTGSFTANAVIQALSFSANAAKLKTTSSTRTLSAVIRRNQNAGSFTADAFLAPSFRINAVKFKTTSSSRTANAVIRATQTVAYTADAAISYGFTANANIRGTVSTGFTINAVKLARIFVDDFNRVTTPDQYLGGQWSWHPIDSDTEDPTQVKAYTDGSTILLPDQGTFFFDSYVGFPIALTGDVYFDFEVPATWSTDFPRYGLSLDSNGNFYGIYVGASSPTQWKLSITTAGGFTFTPTPSQWYRVHARWNGTTLTANVWLRSGSEPAGWQLSTAQAFTIYSHATGFNPPFLDLYEFPTGSDGRLDNIEVWTSQPAWFGFGGFQAQAHLLKIQTGSFTASAFLRDKGFTAAAVIGQSPSRSVIARAMLRKTISGSFSADATFTTDGRRFGSLTADAWVFTPGLATSFAADANFVPVSLRDPGRGQGPGGGNAGGGPSGGQGANRDIFIRVDGVDITDDVKYDYTKFVSSVSGRPGEFEMVVVDRDHIYDFSEGTNQTVTLDVGGRRVWAGWASVVTATYAFDVDDTTDPDDTTRWWILTGPDVNVLFAKRVVYDHDNPANGTLHSFAVDTFDGDIIRYVVRHYTDLEADGITLNLSDVGTPIPDDPGPGGAVPGRTFGEFMYYVSQLSGGIGYIDPTMVLHYEDDDTEDAPFRLTDRPANRSNYAGVADFRMMRNGAQLINDAQIWGAGQGKPTMTYKRVQDATSRHDHGRWQEGDLRGDLYKQPSVNRVANSMVYGSPQNLRGHKDDQPIYRARVYRDGLTAGMKVRVESEVFGVSEVIPIRLMTVTFPTPYNPVYELEMSHELDAIWSISEWPPFPKYTYPPGGGGGYPPRPHDPHDPPKTETGCTDEVCGITDSFSREINVAWGTTDAGIDWDTTASGVAMSIDGDSAIMNYPGVAVYSASPNATALLPMSSDRVRYAFTITSDGTPTGGGHSAFTAVIANTYQVMYQHSTGGAKTLTLHHYAFPTTTSEPISWSPTVGQKYQLRWEVDAGVEQRVRVWPDGDPEPSSWTIVQDLTGLSNGAGTTSQFHWSLDLYAGIFGSTAGPFGVALDNLDIEGVNLCGTYKFDTFDRDVISGWGQAETTGYVWTKNTGAGGTAAVDAPRGALASVPTGLGLDMFVKASGPWNFGSSFVFTGVFTIDSKPGSGSSTLQFGAGATEASRVDLTWDSSSATLTVTNINTPIPAIVSTAFAAVPIPVEDVQYVLEWDHNPAGTIDRARYYAAGGTVPDWQVTRDASEEAASPGEEEFSMILLNDSGDTMFVIFRSMDFSYDGRPCYGGCETTLMLDHFEGRTVALGWGTASSGVPWITTDQSPQNEKYRVESGTGVIDLRGIPNVINGALANGPAGSADIHPTVTLPFTVHGRWRINRNYTDVPFRTDPGGIGNNTSMGWTLRAGSFLNYDIEVTFSGYSLNQGPVAHTTYVNTARIGGGTTFLQDVVTHDDVSSILISQQSDDVPLYFADTWYEIRIQLVHGAGVQWKIWPSGGSEPGWHTTPVIVPDDYVFGLLQVILASPVNNNSSSDLLYEVDYIELENCGGVTFPDTTTGTPPGQNSYGCEVATRVSSTVYSVSYLIAGDSQVSVNGLTYTPGTDYTTSGSRITFTNAQAIDAVVYACYRGA